MRGVLREERGSALLEFALVGGLLIGLTLGALQWAINIGTIQALEQGAREGGRYYAITGDEAGARAKVEQILVNSSLSVAASRFDRNRDITISQGADGYITLTARYSQPNFVPGLPRLFGQGQNDPGQWTFTASATFRRETP